MLVSKFQSLEITCEILINRDRQIKKDQTLMMKEELLLFINVVYLPEIHLKQHMVHYCPKTLS